MLNVWNRIHFFYDKNCLGTQKTVKIPITKFAKSPKTAVRIPMKISKQIFIENACISRQNMYNPLVPLYHRIKLR